MSYIALSGIGNVFGSIQSQNMYNGLALQQLAQYNTMQLQGMQQSKILGFNPSLLQNAIKYQKTDYEIALEELDAEFPGSKDLF